MGGTIDVESEPGRGTVFTVRVSMRYVERDAKGSLEESDDADALCDVSQGDAPAPRGADLSGVRVLLVEDNELNSEIAVALLESLGAAAETAANGQEALDALDASEPGHFDVVLMDIQMPVMTASEPRAASARASAMICARCPSWCSRPTRSPRMCRNRSAPAPTTISPSPSA